MHMSTAQERLEFACELVIVGRHWRTKLDERLKPLGMSQARWAALYWLSQAKGGISQAALAERAAVEPPSLVRMIDLLESQGLVERRPSATDRRVNLLHVTEAAHAVVAEIEAVADTLRREVVADLTGAELRAAVKMLGAMRARLDQASTPSAPIAMARGGLEFAGADPLAHRARRSAA